jgi:Na+/glutamate symporter
LGIVSGIMLNLVRRGPQSSGVAWNDPAVLSTILMFAWLLAAVLAGRFYRPAREGRKVAYMTVVSFVFLVIALGIGLLLQSGHGDLRSRRGSQGRASVSQGGPWV